MRLEFVKAFVDITRSVFADALDMEVSVGPVSLEDSLRAKEAVAVMIELRGDLQGRILLHMEKPAALAVAERMTGRFRLSDSLVESCVAELTSMAVGRTISWINDRAYKIEMSPPAVESDGRYESSVDGVETLVFPLKTACGEATLNVSFIDLRYGADVA